MRWSYLRHCCWSEGQAKATVSYLVGANAALSAERDYVARVLPGALLPGSHYRWAQVLLRDEGRQSMSSGRPSATEWLT